MYYLIYKGMLRKKAVYKARFIFNAPGFELYLQNCLLIQQAIKSTMVLIKWKIKSAPNINFLMFNGS